jgi:hypothetical protein
MKRVVMVLIVALLLALIAACAPISTSEDESTSLPWVELPDTRTIPSEWGSLVAVSNSSKFPDVFQLWFENEVGEIHLVVFDNSSRSLVNSSRAIARQ